MMSCKKGIPVILCFLLLSSSVYSQKFSAGLFAGLSTSQVSGDRSGGFNKIGLLAGGNVMTRLSAHFDIEMEMMFIQKGSRKPYDTENSDFTYYRMSVNYVEVPVLINYNYSKDIIFYAGPSVSQLVFSEEEDQYGIVSGQKPFNKIELSINGGMYYQLFKNFYIDIRISNSVIPIRDNPSGISTTFNHGQYNTVLSFSFKYRFKGSAE